LGTPSAAKPEFLPARQSTENSVPPARHGSGTKSAQSRISFSGAGFHGDDSMREAIQADFIHPLPPALPADISALSDDECLARLARVIEQHDSAQLGEVAQLIGRLAVSIE
jgi:hypothetical protein